MLRASLLAVFAVVAVLLCPVSADEFPLDGNGEQQQCSGMYSKSSWGGTLDPRITVRFEPKPNDEAAIVSLVIFEYEDQNYLGRFVSPDDRDERVYICTPDAVKASLCRPGHEGEFLTAVDTNTTSKARIFTTAMHLSSSKPLDYSIARTGYYCVWALAYTPTDLDFSGVVVFQNSYGELPASQIPKLAFYGGLTIVYAVIGALWAFLYVQHRRDILPVQNYITAIIIFLVVEMAITWVFYDYMNRHGTNTLSKFLMTLVAVLNAGRNSFSFFLLLIVCLGYGVVKPSLGGLMKWVRILAGLHFVFGVVYAVASLTITPESAGPFVLLVILPLAATLTAFYVWTLNALKLTMKELAERKQHQKGLMYRRLWWCLLASILVIFAFFFLNSLTFAGHGSPDFVPTHWKTRWFVLDGWLNLVYLADLCVISYLWRPTANNRRFAMSDELAQDEDGGFEIRSIGGGSELDEDEERDKDIEASAGTAGASGSGSGSGQPQPQPQPQQRGTTTRASVEEPIFEVGEVDGWSDGEIMSSDDEDDEHGRRGGGDSSSDDEGGRKRKGEESQRLTGGKKD